MKKSADSQTRFYYQKNFARLPERAMDVKNGQSEIVIFEETAVLKSNDAIAAGPIHEMPPPKPHSFDSYTYARRSHWRHFNGLDVELYGEKKDLDKEQLKSYQDLLVLRFIRDNIPVGARILDVGGGTSRILAHLAMTYECWNIDKLEGMGNGPREVNDPPYRLVRDYMGNYSSELPDNYFDLVFSISALEHVPQQDTTLFDKIIADIDRVLRPGGLSLHLFDVILKPNAFWTNKFTHHIFSKIDTVNKSVSPEAMRTDPDFYAMSEEAYNKTWLHSTKKPYSEHGLPSSLNILWRKSEPANGVTVSKQTSFTVVTSCLNVAATIDRTIQSVISQAGDFVLNYYVWDGGSTDGTLDRLCYWADLIGKEGDYQNIRFSWVSRPGCSIYDALWEGFDSQYVNPSDFMTWLNGDEVLAPNALAYVAQIAKFEPGIEWVGGIVRVLDENDQVEEDLDNTVPTEVIREGLCDGKHGRRLQHQGMFFRKSLWFKAKHALHGFCVAGDWSLWRAFSEHAKYHQLDKPLAVILSRARQQSSPDEYEAEISAALSMAQRDVLFAELYAKRKAMRCELVRLSSTTAQPVKRNESAETYFTLLNSRIDNIKGALDHAE